MSFVTLLTRKASLYPVFLLLVTVSDVRQSCSAAAAAGSNKPSASSDTGGVNYHDEEEYNYNYDDQQQHKSNNYEQVQSYDYKQANPIDTSILCYSCDYVYLAKENHVEGYPNCNDPFNDVDIDRKSCKGPCSKKYELTNGNLRVTRDCLPNCMDRSDETSYTKCCKTKLCNGASSTTLKFTRHHLILLLSCCALALTRL